MLKNDNYGFNCSKTTIEIQFEFEKTHIAANLSTGTLGRQDHEGLSATCTDLETLRSLPCLSKICLHEEALAQTEQPWSKQTMDTTV